VESVRQERKRSMVERIYQRALSSEWKTERATKDWSGDSEDGEDDELPCVTGGEGEGDCIYPRLFSSPLHHFFVRLTFRSGAGFLGRSSGRGGRLTATGDGANPWSTAALRRLRLLPLTRPWPRRPIVPRRARVIVVWYTCTDHTHTRLTYTVSQKKVNCCTAGCNFVNMDQFKKKSTVIKLTKFPERCILLVNC